MKVKQVCRECGSENVDVESTTKWNIETQCWDITSCTYDDHGFCEDCDCDTRIDSVEIS